MVIKLDINIGDIVLGGKFKNKRIEVKTIGKDELGQPTINGKSILKFRIEKLMPKDKQSKKTRESLTLEHFVSYLLKDTMAEQVDKKITLTQKEIDRASEDWTIIRRKQADGKYWVAAVHVPTGAVHLKGETVDTKEEVPKAIQQVNRWLSKMSQGGKAADRGRHRRWEKEDERKKMGEGTKITKSQLKEMIRESIREQISAPGQSESVEDLYHEANVLLMQVDDIMDVLIRKESEHKTHRLVSVRQMIASLVNKIKKTQHLSASYMD